MGLPAADLARLSTLLDEARAQEALVSAAVEQRGFEPEGGEAIALGVGLALDQSVPAQAAQVVGHPSGAEVRFRNSKLLAVL
jgi:hypothetical protein